MEICITEIKRLVQLVGQSWSPRRIRGTFSIRIGDRVIPDTEWLEGHVNSGGDPLRLILYGLPVEKWSLAEAFEKLNGKTVILSDTKSEIEFVVRYSSILNDAAVKGQQDKDHLVRGTFKLPGNDQFALDVYEPEISGRRRVNLQGSLDALLKVHELIDRDGSCALADET